jgi:hypothetical protein
VEFAPRRISYWRLGKRRDAQLCPHFGRVGPRRAWQRQLPMRASRQLTGAPSRSRGAFRPSFAGRSALWSKRAQGRPGAGWHPRSAARHGAQKKPHSSIQVKPNTRPSLRDGRTAYAVLSREPNSLWPPSPQRKSPAPRRLTRRPHPPGLDRSDDGQDHTVLPYARLVGATGFDGVVHVAVEILARRT